MASARQTKTSTSTSKTRRPRAQRTTTSTQKKVLKNDKEVSGKKMTKSKIPRKTQPAKEKASKKPTPKKNTTTAIKNKAKSSHNENTKLKKTVGSFTSTKFSSSKQSIHRGIIIAAMCFLVFGASLIANSFLPFEKLNTQLAQLGMTQGSTTTQTYTEPSFDLSSDIPTTLTASLQVNFFLSNATEPQVAIINTTTDDTTNLAAEHSGSDTYTFEIPVIEGTESGNYLFKVTALDMDDQQLQVFTSNNFYIEAPIPYLQPDFSLETTIPTELTSPLQVTFDLQNAHEPLVTLVHKNSGDEMTLVSSQTAGASSHSFTIPVAELSNDTYFFEVDALDTNQQPVQVFTSDRFIVNYTQEQTTFYEPVFDLMTNIPDILTSDLSVEFTLLHATEPTVKLKHHETPTYTTISVTEGNPTDVHQFTLPISDLPAGTYSFTTTAKDDNENLATVYTSDQFVIETTTDTTTDATSDDANNTDSNTSDVEDESITTDTTPETPTILEPDFTLHTTIPSTLSTARAIEFNLTDSDTIRAVVQNVDTKNELTLVHHKVITNRYKTTIPVDTLDTGEYRLKFYANNETLDEPEIFYSRIFAISKSEETEVPENLTTPTVTISSPKGSKISGRATIEVTATKPFSFAELHARAVNSTEEKFIALASNSSSGNWTFTIDSTKLSNGPYVFHARTKFDGSLLRSEPLSLDVYNIPAEPVVKNEPVSVPTPEPEPVATQESAAEIIPTDGPNEPEQEEQEPETTTQVSNTSNPIDIELKERDAVLTDLMQSYAKAIESGDASAIELANDNLSEYRQSLTTELQTESSDEFFEEELLAKIVDIQERVEKFERLRATRQAALVDSDGDGVSDQDEEELYGTDPQLTDTDGDGVSDNEELTRGTDPTKNDPQARIVYESPQQSAGLVREDVLLVKRVASTQTTTETNPAKTPDTELATQEKEPDQADTPTTPIKLTSDESLFIEGSALPNSLVTIYVFSTPTVVTVQTDADGSFVYTFDKELADGEHEVYVAVTDNGGRIVAQSNPFAFLVERAQAFTPVDAAEDEISSTQEVRQSAVSPYSVAIGAGIIVLGIILLIIGISMRQTQRKEEGLDTTDDDA